MKRIRVFLGVAVVMSILAGFFPVYAATLCDCDLNRDGRCNMNDWLLFGKQWGHNDCLTPGVICACDINHDGKCNMSDWLLFGKPWGRMDCLVPTNTTLEGVWITVSSDNLNYDERPYMVFDGNGHLTDIAAFNINTMDPGAYTVQDNGSVSFVINGSNGGSITAYGRLISDTEMDVTYEVGGQATTVHCVKVPDRSYLAGVWWGTLVDSGQVNQYPVVFKVDSTGSVIYFEGFATPVSGAMFGTENTMSAFFRTGATGEYNQFAIFGNQMYHNTIQAEYVTNSSSGGGTVLLEREGMLIDETHYIEVDIDVYCSNDRHYIHGYIDDPDHILTGAYIVGPYGRVDLVYNAYPEMPEMWTNPPSVSLEVPEVFPQTWTAVVTYGSGSTEMFDQVKFGCTDSD